MNLPEMVQRLKRIVRLSILDDDMLTDLAVVVAVERHPAGTVICRQGEPGDKFYAIEVGQVLVRTKVGEQEVDVARLSGRDVFGERALMGALPRTATVMAETSVDLLTLDRADYENLLEKHPSLEQILVGSEVPPLLRRVLLFSRLSDRELKALCEYVGVQVYPSGRLVVAEGDMGTTMYMVIKGDLVAYRLDERGRRRPVRAFKEGEAFGETSLLVGEPRDATVITKTYAELCYLNKASFDEFLKAYPDVQGRLQVRADVERKWRAKPFPGQNRGEIIATKDSKHWMVFVRAAMRPVWLWMLGGVILAFHIFGLDLTGIVGALLVALTALWLLIAVAVVTWHVIDWRNDFYIITSQRVIHIERVLLRAKATDVMPIEQVQDVGIDRDLWGKLWGYGRVRITSAAAARGAMNLVFVRAPESFQQSIFEQMRRARFRVELTERAEIQRTIKEVLGLTPPEDFTEGRPSRDEDRLPSWLTLLAQSQLVEWLRQIITESGVMVLLRRPHLPRQEIREADRVIWRKHWWFLLATTYRPLLACLVFSAALVAVVWLGWFSSLELPQSLLVGAFFFLSLSLTAALLRLAWQVEDWRNDQYIVTDTHIIDTERSPLFLKESVRQASLEKIQTTSASTKGFWAGVLNLGDVIIETAGEEGSLTFTQVQNPDRVQAEIDRRREAYRASLRRQERGGRHVEISRWLSAYDDVKCEEETRARRGAEERGQDQSGLEV